jgi:hypothetical protein
MTYKAFSDTNYSWFPPGINSILLDYIYRDSHNLASFFNIFTIGKKE